MSDYGPVTRQPPRPAPPPAIIWIMAAIFVGLELAAELAESGVIDWPRLRIEMYVIGGFWDLYFEAARTGRAVPIEFWTSFLTHAFLHGSLFHLIMNGVIFLALGGLLANALGTGRFLVIFAGSAITGALVFGLIADTDGPLVGASGAIFGFFGAFKRWEWRYIRLSGAPANRFWGTIAGLVLLNLALSLFLVGGALTWEAHLGRTLTSK